MDSHKGHKVRAQDVELMSLERRLRVLALWSQDANRRADAAAHRLRTILDRQDAHPLLVTRRAALDL